jgi:sugar O-acyltransferase (sialic acid O-acetyltransferase NeuD family)
MTRKLFIYGAGGFGKEVLDWARRQNAAKPCWSGFCFVDDVTALHEVHGVPVRRFADPEISQQLGDAEFVIGVGEPAGREALARKLGGAGARLGRVIDPSATVSVTARVGEGCVIGVGALVSSDGVMGRNACLISMGIVGHDAQVGDHTVISSKVNLGGASVVGAASYVGTGALIKERAQIGSNAIIGMGSVVYSDIPDDMIALGNPARVARRNTDRKVFR